MSARLAAIEVTLFLDSPSSHADAIETAFGGDEVSPVGRRRQGNETVHFLPYGSVKKLAGPLHPVRCPWSECAQFEIDPASVSGDSVYDNPVYRGWNDVFPGSAHP